MVVRDKIEMQMSLAATVTPHPQLAPGPGTATDSGVRDLEVCLTPGFEA